jgi:DNA-directed RNA polymerase subunit RPC12/RpoP
MNVECPHCLFAIHRVDDAAAGRTIQCPRCAENIVVSPISNGPRNTLLEDRPEAKRFARESLILLFAGLLIPFLTVPAMFCLRQWFPIPVQLIDAAFFWGIVIGIVCEAFAFVRGLKGKRHWAGVVGIVGSTALLLPAACILFYFATHLLFVFWRHPH